MIITLERVAATATGGFKQSSVYGQQMQHYAQL